jgi:hypothetical protein
LIDLASGKAGPTERLRLRLKQTRQTDKVLLVESKGKSMHYCAFVALLLVSLTGVDSLVHAHSRLNIGWESSVGCKKNLNFLSSTQEREAGNRGGLAFLRHSGDRVRAGL